VSELSFKDCGTYGVISSLACSLNDITGNSTVQSENVSYNQRLKAEFIVSTSDAIPHPKMIYPTPPPNIAEVNSFGSSVSY
jgi:hypothetical protein